MFLGRKVLCSGMHSRITTLAEGRMRRATRRSPLLRSVRPLESHD